MSRAQAQYVLVNLLQHILIVFVFRNQDWNNQSLFLKANTTGPIDRFPVWFLLSCLESSEMRNLPSSGGAANRGGARGADPDAGFPLAGPNQSRYKGVITSPGVVKFSAWKRENEIPR